MYNSENFNKWGAIDDKSKRLSPKCHELGLKLW